MIDTSAGAEEYVVLLDEAGHSSGSALKSQVHGRHTPLHLAFSCYLFDDDGRTLLTQRALTKQTWPGVWTNSCCGHPGPGEAISEAVRRRVREELGVRLSEVRLVLPAFRYRAEMEDGVVENEMCPVFVAALPDPGLLSPEPSEVEDTTWVDWHELRADVASGRRAISPWCREQLAAMPGDPWTASADPDQLPPAAMPA